MDQRAHRTRPPTARDTTRTEGRTSMPVPRTDEPDRYVETVKGRDIVVQSRPPVPRRHSGTKIRTLKDAPPG